MSNIIHFSKIAGLEKNYEEAPDGSIYKKALLFVEGDHKDNKGRGHSFPGDRFLRIVNNTNSEFNNGTEIPFMADHSPKLLDDEGNVKKLGTLCSAVECHTIAEDDLPNPKHSHLVGRLGAFGKVKVTNKIQEVINGTIKLLSPGIDPVKDKLVEISAVAFPAIQGLSLYSSDQISFSDHGMTSYTEAKEHIEAWEKPQAELQKKFDIFCGTLRAIEAQDEDEEIAFNANNLRRKALEDYAGDLVDYLKISFDEDTGEEDIYNQNPYAPNVINNQQGQQYSQEETNIVNFSEVPKRTKRTRRGVS